ncbi:MAG: YicC family protein [Clostridium sp.]|nr:YicC family protein [Clostridium sp.]MCM1547286.1 YicC family protein [Ruminococcus sp.]
MIKSMTGFGREQKIIDQYDILVEIKSVNHRYFEYSSRLPRSYNYLDEKLKAFIKDSISRGKVEISVTINNLNGKEVNIKADKLMAVGYVNALRELNDTLGLEDDLTLSKLLKFPDIFNVQKITTDEEYIWGLVKEVALGAVEKFVAMRENEGSALKSDLLSKISEVEKNLLYVEEQAPKTAEAYRERLYQKLRDVLENTDIDEQRIVTEAAVYSEKIAVDEETVRLHSHLGQFRELLEADEPIGRKFDFLVQEINREINTIGSKAQNLDITKCVVDMKADVEKIREQIQNIE